MVCPQNSGGNNGAVNLTAGGRGGVTYTETVNKRL